MEIPTKILVLTDSYDIKQALKAGDMRDALVDLYNELRSLAKHSDDPETVEKATWSLEKLVAHLNDNNINIYEI